MEQATTIGHLVGAQVDLADRAKRAMQNYQGEDQNNYVNCDT